MPYHQSSIRELEMPQGPATPNRPHGPHHRHPQLHPLRLRRSLPRTIASIKSSTASGPAPSACSSGAIPTFAAAYCPRLLRSPAATASRSWSPCPLRDAAAPASPADATPTLTPASNPAGIGRSIASTYRVWGRLLYNPKSDPDVWRRELRTSFGPNATTVETALSNASRILPIITTVHSPSAANNTYWPEIYTNQPIVDPRRKNPYGDTPSPKTFGNATSFDPEMFLSVNAFAEELLSGKRSAKYSPIEVGSWLEMLSTNAGGPLPRNPPNATAEYRRLNIDVQVQAHLGRFFAHKFRAGVYYAIHEKTKGRGSLEAALSVYRQARDRWSQICELTRNVYLRDVTVGELECLRGHWVDRLPAIDGDLADMQARMANAVAEQTPAEHAAILAAIASPAPRPTPNWHHSPPPRFKPGAALAFEIAADVAPTFHYRHLDQGERWQSMPTTATPRAAGHYRAEIPADYTSSPFHLQYYFSAVDPHPTLFPGLGPNLSGQPYFILEQHA